MESDILDEYEIDVKKEEPPNNDAKSTSGSSSDEMDHDQVDALLDEKLKNSETLDPNNPLAHQKVVLKVKGRDHFLPEGWVEVTHNCGMPVYLHKQTRVCSMSRPYFLGPGSLRKHRIPLSAIPCLHYQRETEKEKHGAEALQNAVNGLEDTSSTPIVPAECPVDPDSKENEVKTTAANCVFPSANSLSANDTKEAESIDFLALRRYCEKRFEFQMITVKQFSSWAERKNLQKKRKREEQRQRFLAENPQLISCRPVLPSEKSPAPRSNYSKKAFIANPSGKTPVMILHEYVQFTMRIQPVYQFRELENAATPYGAEVVIDGIKYGNGLGTSKKSAKSAAAEAALRILIPSMQLHSKEESSQGQDPDLEFFDRVRVEDPRISDLSGRAGQPYPYHILLECLKRNDGMGDPEVEFSLKNLNHPTNELHMKVGKHEVSVACKTKRDGKHKASQAILQKLHPHISSWGSLLRMYSKGSVKTLEEKMKKTVKNFHKRDEERSKEKDTSESGKVSKLEKYWQVVRDNPSDFAGWTYLLHFIEQENNIEAAREAFASFLKHYPYCYGYWKMFAGMEINLSNIEAAKTIFEDGVKAIPLSVDLWIHYINFAREHLTRGKNEEDSYQHIKKLFQRALSAAGREFRSDRLWDLYINLEEESKQLKEVTAAYDRLLAIPTQLYSYHFEKFRKHVKKNNPREILSIDEFLELRKCVVSELKHDVAMGDKELEVEDKAVVKEDKLPTNPGLDEDALPDLEPDGKSIEKEMMMNAEELDLMRKKIVEKRKAVHEKNEVEVGKRWSFEEAIKRPYFHVKPLEKAQLKNWKDYLDYEIQNGTLETTVILFERCMIACALYEDMWLKYAKYMEEKNPDAADRVYERACKIHLPRKPSIHFSWASYEETRGRVDKAEKIVDELGETLKDMLEITLRKINLERRRGNDDKVEEMYLKCIAEAKMSQMSSHFATKYARYLFKVKQDYEKAHQILKDALQNDPGNSYLFLQLIDVGFQQMPMDKTTILEAFNRALSSNINHNQKLQFVQRILEFLENFSSDLLCVQEAYEECAKMFKSCASGKRVTEESEEGKDKKLKTEVNGTAATVSTCCSYS